MAEWNKTVLYVCVVVLMIAALDGCKNPFEPDYGTLELHFVNQLSFEVKVFVRPDESLVSGDTENVVLRSGQNHTFKFKRTSSEEPASAYWVRAENGGDWVTIGSGWVVGSKTIYLQ